MSDVSYNFLCMFGEIAQILHDVIVRIAQKPRPCENFNNLTKVTKQLQSLQFFQIIDIIWSIKVTK